MKHVFRYLIQRWTGSPEHNAHRAIEAMLPVASLYGMDLLQVDEAWLHDRKPR